MVFELRSLEMLGSRRLRHHRGHMRWSKLQHCLASGLFLAFQFISAPRRRKRRARGNRPRRSAANSCSTASARAGPSKEACLLSECKHHALHGEIRGIDHSIYKRGKRVVESPRAAFRRHPARPGSNKTQDLLTVQVAHYKKSDTYKSDTYVYIHICDTCTYTVIHIYIHVICMQYIIYRLEYMNVYGSQVKMSTPDRPRAAAMQGHKSTRPSSNTCSP